MKTKRIILLSLVPPMDITPYFLEHQKGCYVKGNQPLNFFAFSFEFLFYYFFLLLFATLLLPKKEKSITFANKENNGKQISQCKGNQN